MYVKRNMGFNIFDFQALAYRGGRLLRVLPRHPVPPGPTFGRGGHTVGDHGRVRHVVPQELHPQVAEGRQGRPGRERQQQQGGVRLQGHMRQEELRHGGEFDFSHIFVLLFFIALLMRAERREAAFWLDVG